jgi:hypothetical protein
MKVGIFFGGELRTGGTRIRNNLVKYAPEDMEFIYDINRINEVDLVIFHHQYRGDLDFFLHNCNKPMIFLISELQNSKEYFKQFFSNPLLKMTYTFHPLKHLGYIDENDTTNHVLGAWGFDEQLFGQENPYDLVNRDRRDTSICFGFYDSERYSEQYMAVKQIGGKLIHLDIKKWDFLRQGLFFDENHHTYKEWVEDHELVDLYKSVKFVSGLRSHAGFEVPVLEGCSMGAVPICFDNIYYRQFFNDFAIFIPEEFDIDMVNNLASIYRNYDQFKLRVEQIKLVRERFKWETIGKNFWKEVIQSL